jgi:hypothetical protein
METKEIKVGDYIRGFETKPKSLDFAYQYVGMIGRVVSLYESSIAVEFSGGTIVHYPKDQAIEHLCNDDMKDFEKGLNANAKDNINPEHYKSKSKETIERLQDNLTQGEFKGYLKGNILKYLDRYEHKNGVEDLNKAQWYLNKLIELEK